MLWRLLISGQLGNWCSTKFRTLESTVLERQNHISGRTIDPQIKTHSLGLAIVSREANKKQRPLSELFTWAPLKNSETLKPSRHES